MDFRLILSTFALIFLAELGDKTQFAAMAASAGSKQPVSILIGAILALSLSSVIAVIAGSLIGDYVPIKYIKVGAGILFIVFGILYLKEAFVPQEVQKEGEEAVVEESFWSESIVKIARVFEERELQMFKDVADALEESAFLTTVKEIISEEEGHLQKLYSIKGDSASGREAVIEGKEKGRFAAMEKVYTCTGDDMCLIQDLYNREVAMADFYRLTADKMKFGSAKKSLKMLAEEEMDHAKRLSVHLEGEKA
jgi:rubrerythrin